MRYFLCFIFPPLAVLLCGKPIAAFLNLILFLCGFVPGIVHGLIIVSSWERVRQQNRMMQQYSQAYRPLPPLA